MWHKDYKIKSFCSIASRIRGLTILYMGINSLSTAVREIHNKPFNTYRVFAAGKNRKTHISKRIVVKYISSNNAARPLRSIAL
jgi:hypothetical protein